MLYATRAATDQLRRIHGISAEIVSQSQVGDLYIVHVRVRDREGRTDEDLGIVPLTDAHGRPLQGDALANAVLKAITKAKRRATLSLCGLGMLDETEVETLPEAPEEASRDQPSAPAPAATGKPGGAPAGEREVEYYQRLVAIAQALGIPTVPVSHLAGDREALVAKGRELKRLLQAAGGGVDGTHLQGIWDRLVQTAQVYGLHTPGVEYHPVAPLAERLEAIRRLREEVERAMRRPYGEHLRERALVADRD